MKPLGIILLCVFTYSISQAQQLQIINTGGGHLTNNQGSLSFSIGEVITETVAQDQILTQGFFQTNITVTAVNEISQLAYELLAYPNPTKDYVILKISKEKLNNLNYFLYDKFGRLLASEQITTNQTQIPFNFLSPSTYYLKIIDEQIEVMTFKIIKIK